MADNTNPGTASALNADASTAAADTEWASDVDINAIALSATFEVKLDQAVGDSGSTVESSGHTA